MCGVHRTVQTRNHCSFLGRHFHRLVVPPLLLRSQDGDHWGWEVSSVPHSTFWPLWAHHLATRSALHFCHNSQGERTCALKIASVSTEECKLGHGNSSVGLFHKHHFYFFKAQVRSVTLVQTEISQQLLDGLSWNLIQTFMVSRGWILLT